MTEVAAKSWPKPVYTGRAHKPEGVHAELVFSYMTAPQMQAKVESLTGYQHPAFIQYGAILGQFDSKTGVRTTDRPSLLSVLLMQRIAGDLAKVVLEREAFLSPEERSVFGTTDLNAAPAEADLRSFMNSLYTTWLGEAPADTALIALVDCFYNELQSSQKATAAYQAVLAVLLQHGGLYYT